MQYVLSRRKRIVPPLIRKYLADVYRPAVGMLLWIVTRILTWLLFLPELLSFRNVDFDKADFCRFYESIFDLTEPRWPSLLTEYFRQYLDSEFFRSMKIVDPSIEIAVGEGASSICYLNYSFTTGTEYCFDHCRQFQDRLPHKEFVYFDLKVPQTLKHGTYRTIVMIHSIDDFDSPETEKIFQAFQYILTKGGNAFFSGFTELYYKKWFPFHIYKMFGGKKTFFEYRKLYTQNLIGRPQIEKYLEPVGFRIKQYNEFNCDPRFMFIYIAEKFNFKNFPLAEMKTRLWKSRSLKAIHSKINGVLAMAMYRGEMRYREKGTRGINFFCWAEKQ